MAWDEPPFRPGTTVHSVYRLTVPLPVRIDTPKGLFTLRVRNGPDIHSASVAEFVGPTGKVHWEHLYFENGKGDRVLLNGLKTVQGELIDRVFQHLVKEGRARYTCGPHQELNWRPGIKSHLPDSPQYDAQFEPFHFSWEDFLAKNREPIPASTPSIP